MQYIIILFSITLLSLATAYWHRKFKQTEEAINALLVKFNDNMRHHRYQLHELNVMNDMRYHQEQLKERIEQLKTREHQLRLQLMELEPELLEKQRQQHQQTAKPKAEATARINELKAQSKQLKASET